MRPSKGFEVTPQWQVDNLTHQGQTKHFRAWAQIKEGDTVLVDAGIFRYDWRGFYLTATVEAVEQPTKRKRFVRIRTNDGSTASISKLSILRTTR